MSGLVARVLWRQVAADRWVALLLVALVAFTSGLVLGSLRTVDAVSTQAVRAAVDDAGPGLRDLVGTSVVPPLPSAAADPTRAYDELVGRVEAGPAADVAVVARPTRWQLDTPTLAAVEPLPRGGPTRRFVLRVDSEFEPSVRLVEGRLPGPPPTPRTYEVVITREAADVMRLAVGDVVPMTSLIPDARLPDLRLQLVGLVEPLDPTADAWVVTPSALRPRLAITDRLSNIRTGVAFTGASSLPALADELGEAPTSLTVRIPVEAGALEPGQAADVAAAARRATARGIGVESAQDAATTLFLGTRLDSLLERFLRQRLPVLAVAVLLLVSTVAAALVVLLLAVRLLLERRRGELALASARGTSPGQLVALFLTEGLLLGVVGAALGLAALRLGTGPSSAGVTGDAGAWEWVVPLVAGLAPAAVLGASVVPAVRTPSARTREEPGRTRSAGRLRGRRRDVLGRRGAQAGLVLVLAVTLAAVVALRSRGVTAAAAAQAGQTVGGGLRVDPLVVLTPVLVAVSAALLVGRLLGHPLAWATRRARRGRGTVAFLGLARASREGGMGALMLVALVLALATALLAGVTGTTVVRATRESAAQLVGAPLRVNGFGYVAQEQQALGDLPGVEAVAPLLTSDSVPLASTAPGTRSASVELLATDPRALADVQARLRGAPGLPSSLADGLAAAVETPAGEAVRLAGVVSSTVRLQGRTPEVGDVVQVTVSQRLIEVEVVGVLDVLAGAPVVDPWVLLDLERLRERTGLVLAPQDLLVAGDPLPSDEAVVDAVGEVGSVVTPAEVAERATSAPLPRALRTSLAPAAAVGAGYAAAAVLLTLLLGASRRTTFLAHLRALGLAPRQAGGLVALEVLPAAVAALATGLLVGVGLSLLVLPATDLRPLTAAVLPPSPAVDLVLLVTFTVGFLVVVALSVLGAVVAGRRVSPAAAARAVQGD